MTLFFETGNLKFLGKNVIENISETLSAKDEFAELCSSYEAQLSEEPQEGEDKIWSQVNRNSNFSNKKLSSEPKDNHALPSPSPERLIRVSKDENDVNQRSENSWQFSLSSSAPSTFGFPPSSRPLSPPPFPNEHNSILCMYLGKRDLLFVGCSDDTVRVFSISTGEQAHMIPLNSETPISCLTSDPLRQYFFAGFSNGIIRVYSLKGKLVSEFKGHKGKIFSLTMAKSANVLMSSATDGSLRAWDVNSGKELCGYKFTTCHLHYDALRDLLFCGNQDGFFSIAKVGTNPKAQTMEIRILQKKQAHKYILGSIWYSTYHDILITSSSGEFSYWTDITAIPYLEASKNFSPEIEELMDSTVEKIINEELCSISTPKMNHFIIFFYSLFFLFIIFFIHNFFFFIIFFISPTTHNSRIKIC